MPPALAMHIIAHAERRWGELELRMLPSLVRRDEAAVDVGAADGVYSYFLTRLALECHSFEANPSSASLIRRRVPRAHVHACALSDHHGELRLRTPVVTGIPYHGWATVEPANTFAGLPPHEVVSVRVPCATLDSFGLGEVGFLKIDVEGHELEVLRGASRTLRSKRPNLLVEAEDRHRAGAVCQVHGFLASFGYHGWFLDGGVLRPLGDVEDQSGGSSSAGRYINNYIFVSEDRYAADEALQTLFGSATK